MVTLAEIRKQLVKVGYKVSMWQYSEVKELCNCLSENEVIEFATNGHYEGGFALLVSTNHRLLLIDKKPMFLTLDSITYTMIQEVLFTYRLVNSTIHIFTSNEKSLNFTSWNHGPLRSIFSYTQMRMLQSRMGTDMYLTNKQPVANVSNLPHFGRHFPTAATTSLPNLQNNNADDQQPELAESPDREFEPRLNQPYDDETVKELDYEEIPDLPVNLDAAKARTISSISMLGSSALDSGQDNRLAAYKTPPLARRAYFNRYL